MLSRGLERRVNLPVVVTATLELPNVIIGEVLDHFQSARVATKEVLPNVGATLCLIGLIVAIGRAIHQVPKCALGIGLQERIPLATPDDLDHIPASAAEEAFELLDNLSVSTDWSIQTLQVAVDDEGQVVEIVVSGELQGTTALHLVHFAIAQECPDVLLAGVFDAAVVEVAVELCLVNRVDRSKAHGDGGELPEVRHQPRVGVGGQSTTRVRLLLTETIELVGAPSPLGVSPRIHTGGCVTLVENLVATTGVVSASEEVVVTHLIECRGRCVGGDVTTDRNPGTLGPVHGDGRIPANPGTVATLDFLVTGKVGFVLCGNGVQVVRSGNHRDTQVEFFGALEQAEHDFSRSLVTRLSNDRVERFPPFRGLGGIRVHLVERIGILVVDSHPDLFLCLVDRDMSPGRDCPHEVSYKSSGVGLGPGNVSGYRPTWFSMKRWACSSVG